MRRRSLIPNPYRCLTGLRVSLASVVVMVVLLALEHAMCALAGTSSLLCQAMQAPYEWWLAAAIVAGIAYSAYAAYVDFFRGRYYSDLARLQQQH